MNDSDSYPPEVQQRITELQTLIKETTDKTIVLSKLLDQLSEKDPTNQKIKSASIVTGYLLHKGLLPWVHHFIIRRK